MEPSIIANRSQLMKLARLAARPRLWLAGASSLRRWCSSSKLTMEQYIYKPLEGQGAIRLIHLLPGDTDDPLTAEVNHVRLENSEALQYFALSYAWGGDEKPNMLRTSEGAIPITRSLHSALTRMRDKAEAISVWVDAVCINQDDNDEKCVQIRQMGDIYKKAWVISIDLGDEIGNSDMAYDLIRALGDKDMDSYYNLGPVDPIYAREFWYYGLPPQQHPSWEAMGAILRRPWFRRVWIVQEYVLAAKRLVACGKWVLPWDTLAQAYAFCSNHRISAHITPTGEAAAHESASANMQASHKGHLALHRLWKAKTQFYSSGGSRLIDLLDNFNDTLATRARDHMFSMLDLASDATAQAFDPDYDLPFESLVRRYAAEFIKQGHGSRMLSMAGLASQPLRFPSWIPDWTRKVNRLFINSPEPCPSVYSAGGDAAAEFTCSVSDDLSILKTRGGVFDTIKEVGQATTEHPHQLSTTKPLRPALDRLAEADEMIEKCSSCYPTGESVMDAYWRALAGNLLEDDQELRDGDIRYYLVYRELMRHLEKKMESTSGDIPISMDPGTIQVGMRFSRRMSGFFGYGRFCITEKGYIGMCDERAQVGDLIAVISGTHAPFVLRKGDERAHHFRLVGHCYIHGIMKGEALVSDGFEMDELYLW